MGRPSTITGEMEDYIRVRLLEHPIATADRIYNDLVKAFEDRDVVIPSESAIIKRITLLRKELAKTPPSELENPWVIGTSRKYDIPGYIFPLLLQIKSRIGDRLTVRRAIWAARLYPAIEKIANEQHPGDALWLLQRVAVISREYAVRDRINESKEKKQADFPDTSQLDDLLFVKGDMSEEAMAQVTIDRMSEKDFNYFWRWYAEKLLSSGAVSEFEAKLISDPTSDFWKSITPETLQKEIEEYERQHNQEIRE